MLTGLVSVTFRQLSPEKIIGLTKQAGLDGIEWGSDIHCPPGERGTAGEIARLMAANGLLTISYGSYYRTGSFAPFEDILSSAEILGAGNIRVWAGEIPSASADEEDWRRSAEDTRRIAGMAAERGIDISFEYHCDTLTDSIQATERLLASVGRDNVFSYWQPPAGISREAGLHSLDRLIELKKLKNMHISFMNDTPTETEWTDMICKASSQAGAVLLEFVKDNDPGNMLRDAALLKKMIGGC
jgi:sugar phosphate isomerase/epimerase